jgi:uncharacterized membrane protein
MKINLNKIKNFLKELPRNSAKYSFLTFLILLFLVLIFCSFLFYKYSILVGKVTPEVFGKQLKLQEKNYQEIIKTWEGHRERSEAIESKIYPDPFR